MTTISGGWGRYPRSGVANCKGEVRRRRPKGFLYLRVFSSPLLACHPRFLFLLQLREGGLSWNSSIFLCYASARSSHLFSNNGPMVTYSSFLMTRPSRKIMTEVSRRKFEKYIKQPTVTNLFVIDWLLRFAWYTFKIFF